jgi:hypothetical protein
MRLGRGVKCTATAADLGQEPVIGEDGTKSSFVELAPAQAKIGTFTLT